MLRRVGRRRRRAVARGELTAVGIVERGSYKVEDAVKEQPWLPNGPIPVDVTWSKPGYERVSHTAPAVATTPPVSVNGVASSPSVVA